MRDTGLDINPIHRSLSRPNLLFGADRELVLASGLLASILIFVVLTLYSTVIGVSLWFLLLALLRMMAKSDPLMRRVYLRHLRYRPAYRATRSPWTIG